MLRSRRAVSPVIASIVLLSVGLFLGSSLSLFVRETAFSYVKVEVIEYSYIYCTSCTDVSNARWRIIFNIINRGTQSAQITHVLVNSKEVDVYGLDGSSGLDSEDIIGTSLPIDGFNLLPGEGSEISVWVGEGLFSSGTRITINVNTINKVTQTRTITLT